MSTLDEYAKAERRFLHDISTPLTVAHGTTGVILGRLQADKDALPPEMLLDRMGKIYISLEKIVTMLNERREVIRPNSAE